MNKQSFISVIMPAYNAEKYIIEAINSVLTQRYDNFELIIIDDGSRDNTAKIIKGYKDKRIKYFHQGNKGVSAARNLGIKHSMGEWLAFLDADDIWLPNTLATYAKNLNDFDLIYGEYTYLGGPNDGKVTTDFSTIPTGKDERIKRLIKGNFIGIGGVCMRKSLTNTYFDEKLKFAEDYNLWLQLFMEDIRIKQIRRVLYRYRIHPASALHNTSHQEYLLAKILTGFAEKSDVAKKQASLYYSNYVNTAIAEQIKGVGTKPDFSEANKFDLTLKAKLKLYLYTNHPVKLQKISKLKNRQAK